MTDTRSQRHPTAIAAITLLTTALVFGMVGCSASATPSGSKAGGSGSSSTDGSGSSSGGAKSTVKVNPCVLSATEAGAIVHEPLNAAKPDAAECRYSGGGYFFSVNVFPNSTATDWQTQVKTANIVHKATPLSGVGDKALGSGTILSVQSGSYILNVLALDDPGTTTWPKSTALAKAIIAKLP